jgi:hypothetical protein
VFLGKGVLSADFILKLYESMKENLWARRAPRDINIYG